MVYFHAQLEASTMMGSPGSGSLSHLVTLHPQFGSKVQWPLLISYLSSS